MYVYLFKHNVAKLHHRNYLHSKETEKKKKPWRMKKNEFFWALLAGSMCSRCLGCLGCCMQHAAGTAVIQDCAAVVTDNLDVQTAACLSLHQVTFNCLEHSLSFIQTFISISMKLLKYPYQILFHWNKEMSQNHSSFIQFCMKLQSEPFI